VYFYGGGWNDGSKEEFEFVASSLTRAGLVVAIPDYRLFPHVTFPAFVEDGAEAVAWAMANADRFGADPSRLYLMGHSAGAQIAALIALDQRYLAAAGVPSPQIAGLIGLSGPYDFLPINEGYLLDLFPEETREASQAINFASADAPPTLLIHGGDDDIVEEGNSQRLAARLRSFGVTVSLKRYDGVGHGRVVVALAPPLDFIAATLDDCIAFIQQH
jgi:acetyl esterase/lipase